MSPGNIPPLLGPRAGVQDVRLDQPRQSPGNAHVSPGNSPPRRGHGAGVQGVIRDQPTRQLVPGVNPNPIQGPPGPAVANGPNLPPRAQAMLVVEVPRTVPQPPDAGLTETEAKYGTFNQRIFPEMTENSEGYWWRKRLTEAGIMTPTQSEIRYDRIPQDPPSLHTLFISSRTGQHVAVIGAGRMLLNEYLGLCLKEYIQLLIEVFRLHNNKIESSLFPLLTPQADNGTS